VIAAVQALNRQTPASLMPTRRGSMDCSRSSRNAPDEVLDVLASSLVLILEGAAASVGRSTGRSHCGHARAATRAHRRTYAIIPACSVSAPHCSGRFGAAFLSV
jgi:hypothetical protein